MVKSLSLNSNELEGDVHKVLHATVSDVQERYYGTHDIALFNILTKRDVRTEQVCCCTTCLRSP